MGSKNASANISVAELVTQLARYAYGESSAVGLTPARWTALRYFSRANRFSRTVSAFAAFHGTSRGTASQTVKGLVREGYLARTRCASDGRSARLDVTDRAKGILMEDPIQRLVCATNSLSTTARDAVAKGLGRMLAQLAGDLGKPRFGVCTHCKHLRAEDCCLAGGTPYECSFLNEPLDEPELRELCVNFESS
jgi:DNA-binding MarR family transcriptional regulator